MKGVWSFIAGDSRAAPVAVAVAIFTVALASRNSWSGGPMTAIAFVAILAAGLIASVFER